MSLTEKHVEDLKLSLFWSLCLQMTSGFHWRRRFVVYPRPAPATVKSVSAQLALHLQPEELLLNLSLAFLNQGWGTSTQTEDYWLAQ